MIEIKKRENIDERFLLLKIHPLVSLFLWAHQLLKKWKGKDEPREREDRNGGSKRRRTTVAHFLTHWWPLADEPQLIINSQGMSSRSGVWTPSRSLSWSQWSSIRPTILFFFINWRIVGWRIKDDQLHERIKRETAWSVVLFRKIAILQRKKNFMTDLGTLS